MSKSVFVIAVIAAACSSAAFAGEVKKEKAQVPAVKATTMSDADMDKVTAGAGFGVATARDHGGNAWGRGLENANNHNGNNPGFGNCTAGKCF